MTLKDGSLTDASEVTKMTAGMFRNWSTSITGDSLVNIKASGVSPKSGSDLSNQFAKTFSALTMDETDDSSIDSNIWTIDVISDPPASALEDTEYIMASATRTSEDGGGNAYITADQVNSIDFNQDCSIFIRMSTSQDPQSTTTMIMLTDGTIDINLFLHSNSSLSWREKRFDIDPTGNEVKVYSSYNGTSPADTVDISALNDGATWSFKMRASGSGTTNDKSATLFISTIRYLLNTPVTINIFTDATTSTTGTIINSVNTWIADETFGEVDVFVSADDGVNYQAAGGTKELPEIVHFANTGTELKLKFELTSTASKVSIISQYVSWWNLY